MKKTILGAIFALAATCSYAQYCPTEMGTVLKYSSVSDFPEHSEKTITYTVDSIYTDGDRTAVRLLNHTDVAGSLQTQPDEYTTVFYTAGNPDAPTEYLYMQGDDLKAVMEAQIREEIASSGATVSESDLAELMRAIRPSGKLTLTLDPAAPEGTKIPNSSLRVSMETFSMSMHISNGKTAGRETVTVPAGTFEDCLKVTYVMKQNMGQENIKMYATDWYAPGIGLIKQELKDKRGQIVGTDELMSVTRPE